MKFSRTAWGRSTIGLARGCSRSRQENLQEATLRSNVVTFGAAIGACERGSLWQQSVYLLRSLQSQRLEANVVVGSAAISACAKCGQWELVLQMLADLLGRCILSEEMTQTTHPGSKRTVLLQLYDGRSSKRVFHVLHWSVLLSLTR